VPVEAGNNNHRFINARFTDSVAEWLKQKTNLDLAKGKANY
jgi:hypothetical protein